MNAISLYITTSRLVFQNDQNLQDLYRLLPYLRQSLSCSVCGNLLIEPFTPIETNCQHHVCKQCVGERKKLKPACSWCKDYSKYDENTQLRILLQCYKSLCEYVQTKPLFAELKKQSNSISIVNGGISPNISNSLVALIEEGVRFKDSFKCNSGLSKSAYSILPCIYPTTSPINPTNSTATQTLSSTSNPTNYNNCISPETSTLKLYMPNAVSKTDVVATNKLASPPIKTVSNGSTMYSVLYAGNGNKITIKRKTDVAPNVDDDSIPTSPNFKKPISSKSKVMAKRKGCRCGNATATPGKLTCCGQRCPCYVESKSCIDCKCRGCRNPHRADGLKVRPHIPELQNLELNLNNTSNSDTTINLNNINLGPLNPLSSSCGASSSSSNINPTDKFSFLSHQHQLDPPTQPQFNPQFSNGTIQVVGVYTTHLPDVSCSPTLSKMLLREQSATLDPSRISQPNLTSLSTQSLLNHSLFSNSGNSCSSSNSNSSDPLTMNPNNLITIESSLDERCHSENVDV